MSHIAVVIVAAVVAAVAVIVIVVVDRPPPTNCSVGWQGASTLISALVVTKVEGCY